VAVPSDRFGSQEVEGAEEAEGEPGCAEKQDAEAGRGSCAGAAVLKPRTILPCNPA